MCSVCVRGACVRACGHNTHGHVHLCTRVHTRVVQSGRRRIVCGTTCMYYVLFMYVCTSYDVRTHTSYEYIVHRTRTMCTRYLYIAPCTSYVYIGSSTLYKIEKGTRTMYYVLYIYNMYLVHRMNIQRY